MRIYLIFLRHTSLISLRNLVLRLSFDSFTEAFKALEQFWGSSFCSRKFIRSEYVVGTPINMEGLRGMHLSGSNSSLHT